MIMKMDRRFAHAVSAIAYALIRPSATVLAGILLCAHAAAAAPDPLIFFGDRNLPPYEFLDNGEPKGANVDLVRAIGRTLGRPVEVRLMDWADAQSRLHAGDGHALTFLARTEQREKLYDFSQPTLLVAFALFVRADEEDRLASGPMAGRRIGVTSGGLPRTYFESKHPEATLVLVDNGVDGTRKLLRGDIDAFAVNSWTELYLLNELRISGVTSLDPFSEQFGHIAVRNGEGALLAQIDGALAQIKASGEFDRIIDRWSSKKVHLFSDLTVKLVAAAAGISVIVLLLLSGAFVWLRTQKQALGREIAERRRVEQALRDSEAGLRQADLQKDDFLAMLAHELRNPLAPISTAAQLLKLVRLDERRLRETSDIIARQVGHMTSLIDDLLDVSRVTRGLIALDPEVLDVGKVIDAAIEQVRPLIDAKRHRFTVQMTAESAQVHGDRVRLVQVIANLLDNAAKYTPEGGQIILSLSAGNDRINLDVRDNGIGVAAGLRPHVFDLFAQGDRSPDRVQGGLGLGLALVKSLVELHGGSVAVQSDGVGMGSCFTVSLPRLPAPTVQAAAAVDTAPDAACCCASRRLMVVDDNADAAWTLAALLEAKGHVVFVKNDALSALALARGEVLHAFVLDIGLPDMDGYELARRLRAHPQSASAMLIALTGYGQMHDQERSIAAGFDHHLVKPVDTEKLVSLLTQIGSPAAGKSAA